MNRTFQYRLSAVSLLMPTLLILLTVRVLWTPRISHFLVALFLVIVIVMMIAIADVMKVKNALVDVETNVNVTMIVIADVMKV